jgi:hypothetical protein
LNHDGDDRAGEGSTPERRLDIIRHMDDSAVYYRSNYGPLDGPLRAVDVSHCLGVLDHEGKALIGIAFNGQSIPDPRGAIAIFRLAIGKAELPGRYKVDRQRFIRVDE